MSFSRIPEFDGSFHPPDAVGATAAAAGMALVTWLYTDPGSLTKIAPWLHNGCMALLGNSTTALAVIFYLAWLAHLAEACYALSLLAGKGKLRADTGVPWFVSTLLFGYPSLKHLLKATRAQRTPKMPGKHQ